MAYYKQNFMRYLDHRGIKYEDCDLYTVRVTWNCENINKIVVVVSFDEDGEGYVQLSAWAIANFTGNDEKLLKGLVVCNVLNEKFRWVKFFLDDDKDLNVKIDAVIDSETVGEECFSLMRRIINIVDEAYPLILKALWG